MIVARHTCHVFPECCSTHIHHVAEGSLFLVACEKLVSKLALVVFKEYSYHVVYREDELQKLKETYVEEEVDIYAKRKIEFTNVVPLVGENFEVLASYIVDKKAPENEIVVCGKIKNIKDIVIKSKPKHCVVQSLQVLE